MLNDFVELLKNLHLNRELIVLITSMMPIFELRGAIPLAVLHFEMPVVTAYMISWIGNLLPILPIIYFLEPIRKALSHIEIMDRFFTWLYARTYRRGKKVMRLGAIGLTLFVAIPLPVTGAWTGSVMAIIFDIKPRYAFPAIILGVTIAGIVVSSFVSIF
jgi:uncharacterized membrane protein